ncbi:hypothetical protein ACFQGT_08000 [Natrialbaceae archaeon GCM10025810]|uniref:hypothetical protein n=1 Tax=Halovalidus salilacus TaxID=3075124 RepID=UPI0036223A81
MTDDAPRSATDGPADAPGDSFDLSNPDRVRVGVTHGEDDLEVGEPGEYPDGADVMIRPEGESVLFTVDVRAGDHATGHADVPLTLEEARDLRDLLDETVRRVADDE